MKVNIGNLLPRQILNIKYAYIKNFNFTNSKFRRLIIHSTLTPRYAPLGYTPPSFITVKPDIANYKWVIKAENMSTTPNYFFKNTNSYYLDFYLE